MLYMMGQSANGGEGPAEDLLYTTVLGTEPSGVSNLTYKTNGTITMTITDEAVCKEVKNKLGDNKVSGDCVTSGNSTLTVTLGETKEDNPPDVIASCHDPLGALGDQICKGVSMDCSAACDQSNYYYDESQCIACWSECAGFPSCARMYVCTTNGWVASEKIFVEEEMERCPVEEIRTFDSKCTTPNASACRLAERGTYYKAICHPDSEEWEATEYDVYYSDNKCTVPANDYDCKDPNAYDGRDYEFSVNGREVICWCHESSGWGCVYWDTYDSDNQEEYTGPILY